MGEPKHLAVSSTGINLIEEGLRLQAASTGVPYPARECWECGKSGPNVDLQPLGINLLCSGCRSSARHSAREEFNDHRL